jgi:hypothetical protein
MPDKEEWNPYKDYKEPKQGVVMQVIDVLFILVLCYIFLFIPLLLEGAVLVGGD